MDSLTFCQILLIFVLISQLIWLYSKLQYLSFSAVSSSWNLSSPLSFFSCCFYWFFGISPVQAQFRCYAKIWEIFILGFCTSTSVEYYFPGYSPNFPVGLAAPNFTLSPRSSNVISLFEFYTFITMWTSLRLKADNQIISQYISFFSRFDKLSIFSFFFFFFILLYLQIILFYVRVGGYIIQIWCRVCKYYLKDY